MITIDYCFVGKNRFFVEKHDKKMAKIGTIFLNFFLQFFVFFLFLAYYDLPRKFLCLL